MSRMTVHTEDLNSYGFWVKAAGIDLTRFRKNPVMLYNHARSSSYSPEAIFPLGKWKDVRVEADGSLTAEPVFDLSDEAGAKLAKKYADGFVNAASIGIAIKVLSEEKNDLKAGQTRATVLKSELREISFCDIPSNAHAVRLYLDDADGAELCLSLSSDAAATLIDNVLPSLTQPQTMPNKLFALMCATFAINPDAATDESLADAFANFVEEKKTADEQVAELAENAGLDQVVATLKSKVADLESQRAADRAKTLVDLAVSQGKLDRKEAPAFLELATANADGYAGVKKIIDGRKAKTTTLTAAIRQAQAGVDAEVTDTSDADRYDELAASGKLAKLKASNPDEFDRLRAAKIKSLQA